LEFLTFGAAAAIRRDRFKIDGGAARTAKRSLPRFKTE
jgi:hypothetical protein